MVQVLAKKHKDRFLSGICIVAIPKTILEQNPLPSYVSINGNELYVTYTGQTVVVASVPDLSNGVTWGPSLVGPHQRRLQDLTKRGSTTGYLGVNPPASAGQGGMGA